MIPDKVEITYSMLEREASNIVNMIASKFGYKDHPMIDMALNYGKQMYGAKIKAGIASLMGSNKDSNAVIEAGSDTLKDAMSNYLDNFSDRIKQKLNEEQGDTSGRNTPEV